MHRAKLDFNPLFLFYHNITSTSEDASVRFLTVDEVYNWESKIRVTNHQEVPELYKKLTEDDNPVLVLYDYDKLLKRLK